MIRYAIKLIPNQNYNEQPTSLISQTQTNILGRPVPSDPAVPQSLRSDNVVEITLLLLLWMSPSGWLPVSVTGYL